MDVAEPQEAEGRPNGYAGVPFRPAQPDPLWQRAVPVSKECPDTAAKRRGATSRPA